MPNWCINQVHASGPSNQITDLVNALESPPPPYYINQGLVSKEEVSNKWKFSGLLPIPESEISAWYDWCIENWGTKWEASEDGQNDVYIEDDHGVIEWDFETAWNPPLAFFAKISSKYPDIEFYIFYFEPGENFIGKAAIKNGVISDTRREATREDHEEYGFDTFPEEE